MFAMKQWQRRGTARIVLVWVALCYVLNTNSLGGIASAFLPQEPARGKSTPGRFHSLWSDIRRCNPQEEMMGRLVVGMFPPLPPSFEYDEEVAFLQRATGTRINGKDKLQRSIRQWEDDFRSEVDGGNDASYEYDDLIVQRLSAKVKTAVATTVSPTTLLVRWNATYIDPSVAWLVFLSESIPGWTPDFCPYTDQASKVRKFSYSALLRLFGDAITTGKLRVPLACIEGTSTYEFREGTSDGATKAIVSITEDLAYAQDLNRGALLNRLCARDLQFFLEVARKPLEYPREGAKQEITDDEQSLGNETYEYWEDLVSEVLPWRSVPGMMDPMYIESQSEDDLNVNLPLIFGTFSVVLVLLFANWVAPNLIGQSLFGPPSYIVPPSELNDIIPY